MGWELRSCRGEPPCPEWTDALLLPRSTDNRPAVTWGGPRSRGPIRWPGLWSHYTCDAWGRRKGRRSVFVCVLFECRNTSMCVCVCSYLMRMVNWWSLPGSLFVCLEIVITSSPSVLLGCWGLQEMLARKKLMSCFGFCPQIKLKHKYFLAR